MGSYTFKEFKETETFSSTKTQFGQDTSSRTLFTVLFDLKPVVALARHEPVVNHYNHDN